MNKLLIGLFVCLIPLFSAILYSNSQTMLSEKAYLQIGLEHYLDSRRGRQVLRRGPTAASLYRYPENDAEIKRLFPDCCRFATHDPDSEGPVTGWKRHWYQFAGFVFIKGGLIKIEGDGPDILPAQADAIVALSKKGGDITRKIIPR